jgi:hypothetical protein
MTLLRSLAMKLHAAATIHTNPVTADYADFADGLIRVIRAIRG